MNFKTTTWVMLCAVLLSSWSFTANAQTFSYTGAPIAIPDNGCGTSTYGEATTAVTGAGVIGSTTTLDDVCITISHTWMDDLTVELVSPSNTVVELSSGNGDQGAGYANTCFNAGAPFGITTGTSPFSGTFNPEGDFANFNGESADGTWTLRACDAFEMELGTINAFSIAFLPTNTIAPVAPASGCTGTVTAIVDGSGTPANVDFIDGAGNIYASIANTQNLGAVVVSLFGGSGRQTASNDHYLDRNVAINPTIQPTSAVSVTVYALNSEISALTTASATAGNPVFSVFDLQFAKVAGTATCTPTYPGGGLPVGLFPAPYGTDWAFTASVNSFSEFFILSSSAPLPVELSSFNAYATATGNRIEWTAATEIDLYTYTVERAADPTSFNAFADVAPKGTEYAEAVYATEDYTPAKTTYYRLRMEDLDGSVEYSDVVAVTRDDVRGGITMFPNPANDKVTFDVISETTVGNNVNVVLTDLSGRLIREWTLAPGQHTEISVSDIPSGVYMVSSVSATGAQSQRLILE